MRGYVHGYQERETARLNDQASALVDLLHHGTVYPAGSRVLEVGCGVGSQTITLARRSPGARFTSIDIASDSLATARRRAEVAGLANVEFRHADISSLAGDATTFDHVFVCFVLEHLDSPASALQLMRGLLKPGGTFTVIEGDHGSAFFAPDSVAGRAAIDSLVELQRRAGGDANLGRRLHPLLTEAGYASVSVRPLFVYADQSRPDLVDAFTIRTFTAMIEGVRESAVAAGLLTAEVFDAGIADLYRTAAPDGVFCYTFFKAVAVAGGSPDGADASADGADASADGASARREATG
ncbi:MAG: methyltransferase domain-containing protein [Streptosporangiaceae bacterium]